MNNLVYVATGKKVLDGDEVVLVGVGRDGKKRFENVEVNNFTAQYLIQLGILKFDESDKKEDAPKANIVALNSKLKPSVAQLLQVRMAGVDMRMHFYEELLLNKMMTHQLTRDQAEMSLRAVYFTNKAAYYGMVLKEIALHLDKSYESHISESENLYTISAATGKPYYIEPGFLKTTSTVALFRTEVDAIIACKILSPLKKELFKANGRRK